MFPIFNQKPTLHTKLVAAIFSSGPSFHLEIQTIRQKNDSALRKHSLVQYSCIPSKLIPITHALIVKIKLCTWSSEDLVDKLPSTISLACFVSIVKKGLVEIDAQLEAVTINQQLNQPSTYRGPINCTISKSYQINTGWGLLTTISSLLAFLYNLADRKFRTVGEIRPLLCDFLESVLFQLTSETGRIWLHN